MAESLLDTDIFSEVIRAKARTVVDRASEYIKAHGRLTISVITVVEVVKGFERLRREADIVRFLTDVEAMKVLPLTTDAAILAGRIYGALERSGQPIGRMDPMIAAIALSAGLELVTGNVAHYERLKPMGFDLRIANWREA